MPPKSSKASSSSLTDTWGRANRKLADKTCPGCGIVYRPKKSSSVYCSRDCLWKNNGGHNKQSETWWINAKGYMEGRVWRAGRQVQVKQHRYVMEMSIGRPLLENEDVHHIDGNKLNNDISNLLLINHGEHTRVTNGSRKYKKGYSLNISREERRRRSEMALRIKLDEAGRAAIAKAKGGAA